MSSRILITFIACLLSTGTFADVRDMWATIPDTLLSNTSDINVENISPSLLRAKVSSTLDIQIKLMPATEGDSVVCLLYTYSAPEKESLVVVYDKNWNKVASQYFLLEDVIGKKNAEAYSSLFEPMLISASFCLNSDELELRVSDKYLGDDEKKMLNGVCLQTKVNWKADLLKFN